MPKRLTAPSDQLLNSNRRHLPISIAFGSGLAMGLAPAPLNAFPLAWVALAPLWVLLVTNETRNLTNGSRKFTFYLLPFTFYLSLAWGIGYHGLALSWITGLHPLTWLGVPWLASVAIVLFCWGFITLWGAVLVAIWAWVMVKLAGQGDKETRRRDEETLLRTANNEQPTTTTAQDSKLHPLSFILQLSSFILHPSSFTPHPPPLPPLRRVLLGTALWCGLEWLWSWGPLDWTALAYTQSPGNLALLHLGQFSGASTVTAAIVAVNGLLAEAWISYQRSAVSGQQSAVSGQQSAHREAEASYSSQQSAITSSKLITHHSKSIALLSIAAVLLIVLHLLGYALYLQPLSPSNAAALKVGIIQGNVPTRIKLGGEGIRRATVGYTSGYEALADQKVDAVLTPEGALPFLWNKPDTIHSPLYQAILKRGVPLWLGTFTAQPGGITRSLLTIAANGTTISRYDKIKLVPLGEYIPFQNLLGGIIDILSPISENGLPGAFNQQFDTPFGRAIASICYDSAFPEVFRVQAAAGGQFILTASNLDPYSEVLMAQHQAQDLMRAIETDRWAVRATNTGYSSIIDPHGRVEWRSQPRSYQTYAATIFRRQTQTFYVRWGDWLTPLLLVLGGITFLLPRVLFF